MCLNIGESISILFWLSALAAGFSVTFYILPGAPRYRLHKVLGSIALRGILQTIRLIVSGFNLWKSFFEVFPKQSDYF